MSDHMCAEPGCSYMLHGVPAREYCVEHTVQKLTTAQRALTTAREALEAARTSGPCECGPVSSDGDVIGEHGACYIGIADRALAAIQGGTE